MWIFGAVLAAAVVAVWLVRPTSAEGVLGVVAAVLVPPMIIARWWGNHTYRPTTADVRRILEDALEDRLNLGAFDEFTCVPIAYDSRLENIRIRFNAIAKDRESQREEITVECAILLTDKGKAAVRGLIAELESQ